MRFVKMARKKKIVKEEVVEVEEKVVVAELEEVKSTNKNNEGQ